MTPLAARLFFSPPFIPIWEAAHVLRLDGIYKKNPAGIFVTLESQRQMFSNYPALISILKDYYGFAEEENPFKKARIASERAVAEAKAFASLSEEEKNAVKKVRQIFKARILHCPT